jgi:antitoxin (DNA-binding transcriptional repressor) of toxin-antitoxin stability system
VNILNIYQAKTKLSQLIDRAVEGEEIIIAHVSAIRAIAPAPSQLFRPNARRSEHSRDIYSRAARSLFRSMRNINHPGLKERI